MYFDIYQSVAKRIPTLDIFEETASGPDGFYLLREAFTKPSPSHHPDYIKIQDIVWRKLEPLDGRLARRDPPHRQLYPHKAANLGLLREAGKTRERTCF